MEALHRARGARHATSDLNRILKAAWQRRPPSVAGRREPNLYYATQVGSAPSGSTLLASPLNKRPSL